MYIWMYAHMHTCIYVGSFTYMCVLVSRNNVVKVHAMYMQWTWHKQNLIVIVLDHHNLSFPIICNLIWISYCMLVKNIYSHSTKITILQNFYFLKSQSSLLTSLSNTLFCNHIKSIQTYSESQFTLSNVR